MYIALAMIGVVWPALAILVVSRDLMILAAVLISWLLGKPVEIRPVWISKFNTLAQIAFAALALGARAFGYRRFDAARLACLGGRRLDAGFRRGLYRPMARSHEPLSAAP